MISLKIKTYLLMLMMIMGGFGMVSCGGDETPKPRAYFRIDLPKKEYRSFDTTYPYQFEYPIYARISPKKNPANNPFWLNLEFPAYKGTLHISYMQLNGNLDELMQDTRDLVNKHIPKSNGIDEILIQNPAARVYGTLYDIRGNDAASPYQFCITDSTRHFLRGALYFNVKPNNDSLSPVIDFLRKDIDHLIESFRWK